MNTIYLDSCATTALDSRVRAVLLQCLEEAYANPASQHRAGQRAAARLDLARQSIRESLRMRSVDRLILTSGGTEANNLAIAGLVASAGNDRPRHVVAAGIEHPSVLQAARALTARGWTIRLWPVDGDGVVSMDALDELIDDGTGLVCLMLVNNETGVIQPVQQAAALCAARGVPLHCDAAQAAGKIALDFGELARAGVTSLSIAAHKFHGPRGIGALVIAGGHDTTAPILFGGQQQLGLRPGTEDVALAAALAEALRLATDELEANARRVSSLRDGLEKMLLEQIPDAVVNGFAARRAPHCTNVSFPGDAAVGPVNRQALLMACDAAGIAVSTGSACASGSSEPSPVLRAMELDERRIGSAIRISFSAANTVEETQEAGRRIVNAVKHLRRQNSGKNAVAGPRGNTAKMVESGRENTE